MMRIWPIRKPERKSWQNAEELAARHLQDKGYRILHRNLRLDQYELDIVARNKDTIVFVEVRSRKNSDVSAPEETIRYTKRRKLRAAASRYMARHGEPDVNYRFDVVGVIMNDHEPAHIHHIEYAFTMEEK